MHVAASGRLINCGAEGVIGCFAVDQDARLVCVPEDTESPLQEVLDIANILRAINGHQMAALMLIEESLMLRLSFLEVLVPLGREEVHDGAGDAPRVLLLQLLDAGDALVEHLVAYYPCQSNMITSRLHF